MRARLTALLPGGTGILGPMSEPITTEQLAALAVAVDAGHEIDEDYVSQWVEAWDVADPWTEAQARRG